MALALIGLAATVAALGVMEIDRTPTAEAGAANLGALWPYWLASALVWAGLTALWLALHRGLASGATTTPAGAFWLTAAGIIVVSIAARAAVIVLHEPALSDDVYRHVFDGRNAAHGINPYTVKPADRVGLGDEPYLERPLALILEEGGALEGGERWPGERGLLVRVNNPDQHTIYLPVSQWVFTGVGWALGDRWTDPATGARLVRAVLVGFELAMIGLLLLALRHRRRSPWWAALYAWHPLAVAEIAGSGHQDALGLFFLVVALVLAQLRPDRVVRFTVALALGVLVKPVVLPVAPLLLRGHSWWRWVLAAVVGATVCAAVAAPLLLTSQRRPLDNLASTAERFTLKWAHFGSVYEPLLTLIERRTPDWTNDEQEVLARRVCLGLVGVVLVAIFFGVRNDWAAVRMLMLAMLLLSPTAHPWYALWALAVAPLAMSPAVWVASLTISWGYAQLGDVVEWSVSPWVMVAAYAPVYGAVVLHVVYKSRRRRAEERAADAEAVARLNRPGTPLRPGPGFDR